MARHVLPARRLRINRREIKQIYHKYKPKKREVPPPKPFEPEEQFLDFVELLDPLAPALPVGRSLSEMYWPHGLPGTYLNPVYELLPPPDKSGSNTPPERAVDDGLGNTPSVLHTSGPQRSP